MYDLSQLTVIAYVELDLLCLVMIDLICVVAAFYMKGQKRRFSKILYAVAACYNAYLLTDVIWVVSEFSLTQTSVLFYTVNSIYFIALVVGGYFWFIYVCRRLGVKPAFKKWFIASTAVPAFVVCLLSASSFATRYLFYLDESMKYERGPFIPAYTSVVCAYFFASMFVAAAYAFRKNNKLRHLPHFLMGYSGPILLCYLIQIFCNINIICIGYMVSVLLLFFYDVIHMGLNYEAVLRKKENVIFQSAILAEAYSSFKANLSQNEVFPPVLEMVDGEGVDYTSKFGEKIPSYNDMIAMSRERYIHPDYQESFGRELSAARLIEYFNSGDKMPEYTCKVYSSKLGWHYRRYVSYLSKDPDNDDIVSITVAYVVNVKENYEVLDGTTMLLVDDSKLSREISRDLLEEAGVTVIEAESGAMALEALKTYPAFNMILMDIVMPEMDGIATTAQIRAMEEKGTSQVPIVALTAAGSDAQVVEILKAGANDCISKPIVVNDLAKVMVACLKKNTDTMQKQLRETIRSANTDPLTHVKNIAAYTDKVAEISASMAENRDQLKFAAVLCDVNGLKKENDTYGHSVGDQYIKNCCNIICEVFDHSPVYRIGGDEFVALLTGADYLFADDLMKKLYARIQEAEKLPDTLSGKASFAAGIAYYDPSIDLSVSDTMKRADAEMYNHKTVRRA